MKNWLLLVGAMFSLSLPADVTAQSDVLSSIDACEALPEACILAAEKEKENTEPYSTRWYRLTYLALSAKWVNQKFNMDREELAALAALDTAPPFFKATVYTLHAKMLFTDGDKERGDAFAKDATELLLMNNLIAPHPKHCAELINLANYMGDHDRALALSNWSIERGKTLTRPEFQAEIYTAVGHTYFFVNDFQKARDFYLQALDTKDVIQPSPVRPVLLSNAARIHQQLNRHEDALGYFQQARDAYDAVSQGLDAFGRQYLEMRMAESYIALGQVEQARVIIQSLETKTLNSAHQSLYDKLHSQVM